MPIAIGLERKLEAVQPTDQTSEPNCGTDLASPNPMPVTSTRMSRSKPSKPVGPDGSIARRYIARRIFAASYFICDLETHLRSSSIKGSSDRRGALLQIVARASFVRARQP